MRVCVLELLLQVLDVLGHGVLLSLHFLHLTRKGVHSIYLNKEKDV